jgi:HAD superfamily hydrolase (TIGR01490 family)
MIRVFIFRSCYIFVRVAIAFFDLDRTLLAANSGTLWIRSELGLGHISWFQALRATFWIARYQLGFASIEDAILTAIRTLEGSRESDIRDRTAAFYQGAVRNLFRPGARQALKYHRERGDQIVLLTSSSGYLSQLVAEELGLDAYLCNRFEVDPAGIHTGQLIGALCYGAGKLAYAKDFAAAAGVGLSQCTFYTDSFSDLPVLEAVGTPVAVNPDRRLRTEAQRRGWHVVDWGSP